MKNFEVSQPVTVFGFEALISEVIDITRKPHLYGVQFNGQDKTWVVEEEHIEAVVDNRPVTERIMTFEEAYDALGEDHTLVRQYNLYMQQMHGNEDDMRDLTAYMKLRIVTEALNEDWHPTFSDEEVRYYPWFVLYTEEEYENLDDDDKARCCRVVGRSDTTRARMAVSSLRARPAHPRTRARISALGSPSRHANWRCTPENNSSIFGVILSSDEKLG